MDRGCVGQANCACACICARSLIEKLNSTRLEFIGQEFLQARREIMGANESALHPVEVKSRIVQVSFGNLCPAWWKTKLAARYDLF